MYQGEVEEEHEKNNLTKSGVATEYLQKDEIAKKSQEISRNGTENISAERREQNKLFES
ncbi:MAG: hypothetical protein M3044_10565 [Thermoproteota archaeon]|nr:hypothetical protein [Thermoproteota archaeon]